MTTVSVPLPADMLQALERLIRQGVVPNKAGAIRKALQMFIEDQAVQAVLHAKREPRLRGNLRELARKIR